MYICICVDGMEDNFIWAGSEAADDNPLDALGHVLLLYWNAYNVK